MHTLLVMRFQWHQGQWPQGESVSQTRIFLSKFSVVKCAIIIQKMHKNASFWGNFPKFYRGSPPGTPPAGGGNPLPDPPPFGAPCLHEAFGFRPWCSKNFKTWEKVGHPWNYYFNQVYLFNLFIGLEQNFAYFPFLCPSLLLCGVLFPFSHSSNNGAFFNVCMNNARKNLKLSQNFKLICLN